MRRDLSGLFPLRDRSPSAKLLSAKSSFSGSPTPSIELFRSLNEELKVLSPRVAELEAMMEVIDLALPNELPTEARSHAKSEAVRLLGASAGQLWDELALKQERLTQVRELIAEIKESGSLHRELSIVAHAANLNSSSQDDASPLRVAQPINSAFWNSAAGPQLFSGSSTPLNPSASDDPSPNQSGAPVPAKNTMG